MFDIFLEHKNTVWVAKGRVQDSAYRSTFGTLLVIRSVQFVFIKPRRGFAFETESQKM